ncbi:hypothetical protein TNCV_2820461 [Trichonephila clavipes]|nr:hypothetical protein TNCV_2820461 [Trichonephila clavipes]
MFLKLDPNAALKICRPGQGSGLFGPRATPALRRPWWFASLEKGNTISGVFLVRCGLKLQCESPKAFCVAPYYDVN